ncbi:hypothetical protein LTR36_003995 [Oleoguttula mirabilis]|uniref:Uncharacterized protein n=1 Tax=Oleoguttula mirabilis TaxID=1507867 RepID=A0AAV9JIP8_9PEZI|nr:hypothetical protein LTR36_003995 [Oleoguttula mirabilis]
MPIPNQIDDDLEDHPENHFLSPIHEYERWADDSDDDDDSDEVEWDAGITDFALFDHDKRRAEAGEEHLASRWDDFVSTQEATLHRAVQRARSNSGPDTTRPPLPFDEMPSLTPDSSPHLRDDLAEEVEPYRQHLSASSRRRSVPNFLTMTVTPASGHAGIFADDEDLPISLYVPRVQRVQRASRKLERPGLRYARTMSGKAHVWRRPGWDMYSVGEDAEAERRAEMDMGETVGCGRRG